MKLFLFQGYSTFPPENGDEQMKCLQSYTASGTRKMENFQNAFQIFQFWLVEKINAGNLRTSPLNATPSPRK